MLFPTLRGSIAHTVNDGAIEELVDQMDSRLRALHPTTSARNADSIQFWNSYRDQMFRWRGLTLVDHGTVQVCGSHGIAYQFSFARRFWVSAGAFTVFTAFAGIATKSWVPVAFFGVSYLVISAADHAFWRYRSRVFARRLVNSAAPA